jgi:hypothetical protein
MDRLRSDDITALTTWARNHTGLKTPRTWTRALRVDDAEALFDSIKNPRVNKWVSVFQQPCTLSTLRRWIAVRVARMEAGEGVWSAVYPSGETGPMSFALGGTRPHSSEIGGMPGLPQARSEKRLRAIV